MKVSSPREEKQLPKVATCVRLLVINSPLEFATLLKVQNDLNGVHRAK
jgi:hypothetical protein